MTSESEWYEMVDHNERITQGELIPDCPVLGWRETEFALTGSDHEETLRTHIEAIAVDVVVMTQACDLKHDKVRHVVLCPHYSLADYRKAWEDEMHKSAQNPTKDAWRRHTHHICEGFIWNLAILRPPDEIGDLPVFPRVVDFHEVYSVPRAFIESFIAQRTRTRLRLLPPYREHLSQAFARFFMRVGLPVPVKTTD